MSEADASSKSLHRNARLIGGLTLLSRVLGLVREGVAAHFLGAQSIAANAFAIAFLVPNLFRKLLGEGALSQAFIPLYAQAVRRGQTETGDPPADFAAGSVKLLAGLLIGLTIVGEIILAGGMIAYRGERADVRLMLQFTAIMLPYVVLVCGGAFLSAILQVHKRFGAPAFAPVLLNVVHIAVVCGGAWWLGLRGHGDPLLPEVNALQTKLALWLSIAVLVAGVLQVIVLLPALRAAGFRFRWRLPAWTTDTKKMLRLSLPVAMGAAVLQVSVALDKGISAGLMQGRTTSGEVVTHFDFFGHAVRYPMESGAVVRLNLAQLLYQFPLGIFAIAIATAIYPSLSTAAIAEDRGEFRRVVRQGVLATLWEGLPASVGLMLVAAPAVRLLFQHGYITAHDADLITRDTMFYAGGIWAYSMLQVINRAYYALHDARTPLVASVINVVANVVVEVPLLWWLGEAAMAVGTLVSFSIQAIVMLWLLDRKVGGLGLKELLRPTAKIGLATAAMLGVCLLVRYSSVYPQLTQTGWRASGQIVWGTQLLLLSGIGGGVYLLTTRLLGVRPFSQ
ncbi:MAG TPA: murein biosynthesis integral membrane protein MurJ [Tepidisphaeraceae bacterium]|jgi:putative peptidoglycan lipid II flippase